MKLCLFLDLWRACRLWLSKVIPQLIFYFTRPNWFVFMIQNLLQRPFYERWKMLEKEVIEPRNYERHHIYQSRNPYYRYDLEPFRVRKWGLLTLQYICDLSLCPGPLIQFINDLFKVLTRSEERISGCFLLLPSF